jgi:anti-sigma regulatory factor (Ser/Thr protein kinase)
LCDAELIVSELVTNALLHGEGPITMRVCLNEDSLVVRVIDQGAGFERRLHRGDRAQIGRWGLKIVEDISSRWGVHEGTAHVWFELRWSVSERDSTQLTAQNS